jgi:hypothetical protein
MCCWRRLSGTAESRLGNIAPDATAFSLLTSVVEGGQPQVGAVPTDRVLNEHPPPQLRAHVPNPQLQAGARYLYVGSKEVPWMWK